VGRWEVFFKALRALPGHRSSGGSFSPGLYRKNAQTEQVLGESEAVVKLLVCRSARAVRGRLAERGVMPPQLDDAPGGVSWD